MVGAVGREQQVVHGVERVAGGKGLLLEHIQRGATDALVLQRVDQRRLVDHGAAPHVDQHARGLHRCDGGAVDQPLRVGGQRGRDDDIVRAAHQRMQLFRAQRFIDQVVAARHLGPPAQRDHAHAQRLGQPGGCTTDVPVADDAQRLAMGLLDIELFPAPGRLVAFHAVEVLGEEQHGGRHELTQGTAVHAAAVGERHGAVHQRRKQQRVQPRCARMDPAHARRHRPHLLHQFAAAGPHHKRVGTGGTPGEGLRALAGDDSHVVAKALEHAELGLGGVGQNQQGACVGSHGAIPRTRAALGAQATTVRVAMDHSGPA